MYNLLSLLCTIICLFFVSFLLYTTCCPFFSFFVCFALFLSRCAYSKIFCLHIPVLSFFCLVFAVCSFVRFFFVGRTNELAAHFIVCFFLLFCSRCLLVWFVHSCGVYLAIRFVWFPFFLCLFYCLFVYVCVFPLAGYLFKCTPCCSLIFCRFFLFIYLPVCFFLWRGVYCNICMPCWLLLSLLCFSLNWFFCRLVCFFVFF